MTRMISAAVAVGAATLFGANAAKAEPVFSGNVGLFTDYSFRGYSQTDKNPAIQGGFDYANGMIYAGTWASNVAFGGSIEIDAYGGVKFPLGPVTTDLGFIYYAYPGASDDGAELDYVELKAAASVAPTEQLSLGGGLYYSPEFTAETGAGLYAEVNAAFAVNDVFSLSGAVGNQSAEDAFVPANSVDFFGNQSDNYTTWNIGGTYSAYGFGFDLRYVDTDVDDVGIAEGRVIFGIKRAI